MWSSNPLDTYKEVNSELIEQYEALSKLAPSERTLLVKYKLLIALAIFALRSFAVSSINYRSTIQKVLKSEIGIKSMEVKEHFS